MGVVLVDVHELDDVRVADFPQDRHFAQQALDPGHPRLPDRLDRERLARLDVDAASHNAVVTSTQRLRLLQVEASDPGGATNQKFP